MQTLVQFEWVHVHDRISFMHAGILNASSCEGVEFWELSDVRDIAWLVSCTLISCDDVVEFSPRWR